MIVLTTVPQRLRLPQLRRPIKALSAAGPGEELAAPGGILRLYPENCIKIQMIVVRHLSHNGGWRNPRYPKSNLSRTFRLCQLSKLSYFSRGFSSLPYSFFFCL
jgi:hypothetical protein